MIWKAIAMLRGWRAAYDVEDGSLIVFNPRSECGVHYYEWRSAALHVR